MQDPDTGLPSGHSRVKAWLEQHVLDLGVLWQCKQQGRYGMWVQVSLL